MRIITIFIQPHRHAVCLLPTYKHSMLVKILRYFYSSTSVVRRSPKFQLDRTSSTKRHRQAAMAVMQKNATMDCPPP